MAGQDALIRVRLDTSGARSDLQALYGDMKRAPGVQAPGFGSAAGGAAAGGVPGGGGLNIGSMLGMFAKLAPLAAIAAPAAKDLFQVGSSMLGGVGEALNPFAGLSGADKGRQQTRQQVSEMLGAARGFGLVGKAESQSLYDALAKVNVPIEEGKATIRSELGWSAAKDTFSDAVGRFEVAVTSLANKVSPTT